MATSAADAFVKMIDEEMRKRFAEISVMENPIWRMLNQPELVEISPEWGLIYKGTRRRYLHKCPSGDIRVAKGKKCELCNVEVPEAVQFIVKCSEPIK